MEMDLWFIPQAVSEHATLRLVILRVRTQNYTLTAMVMHNFAQRQDFILLKDEEAGSIFLLLSTPLGTGHLLFVVLRALVPKSS